MEMDKIRELIQLVENSQIQEIELSQRGETIRISKSAGGAPVMPAAAAPVPVPAVATPAPTPAAVPAPSTAGLTEINSPIVGTYYSSASPESAPFVEVGQRVMQGDVLCIVEAMKVMNEIESEYTGVIREISMANGQPVEFGQVLFLIEEG